MPCMKCSNGKWKYGEHGNCVFDSLAACQRAAAAIHIQDKNGNGGVEDPCPELPSGPKPGDFTVAQVYDQANKPR